MNQKSLIVMGTTGLGLILAFFQFLYLPSTGEVNKLRMDVNKYGAMEAKKSVLVQSRLEKIKDVKACMGEIEELRKGFLYKEDQGAFMKRLRELVAGESFDEESVINGGVQQKGDLSLLSFVVNLKGPFDDVYGFVRSLEDLDQIVWLDRIHLNRVPNDTEGLVKLNLNMSVPLANEWE